MNLPSMLSVLERWAAAWAAWAWTGGLQAGLLILVVLALDLALRRRANPAIRHALWVLVIVKLVLPPTLTFPTGIGYWTPRPWAGVASPPANPSAARVAPSPHPTLELSPRSSASPSALPSSPARPAPSSPALTPTGGLFLIGLAGSLAFLAVVVWRARQIHRLLRLAVPASDAWCSRAETLAANLGLSRTPAVLQSAILASPAVCGFLRPRIVIPTHLGASLSADERSDVLLHELLHVRRRDLWLGHLQTLLQIAYWWHPLVWLANDRLRQVREEVVDAAVVTESGRDLEGYTRTLLAVARSAVRSAALTLGLLGIVETRSALRRRITGLLDAGVVAPPRLGPVGALLVSLFAAATLPMAGPAADTNSDDPEPSWQPWSEEAVAAARRSGRPVVVDFTADWCLPSKVGERLFRESSTIRNLLREGRFVLLRADCTTRHETAEDFLRRFGRAGVPLTLLYPASADHAPVALPEALREDEVVSHLKWVLEKPRPWRFVIEVLDGSDRPYGLANRRWSLDELRRSRFGPHTASPVTRVTVKPAVDVPWSKVVDLLDLLKELEVPNVDVQGTETATEPSPSDVMDNYVVAPSADAASPSDRTFRYDLDATTFESTDGKPAAQLRIDPTNRLTRLFRLNLEVVGKALESRLGRSVPDDPASWRQALIDLFATNAIVLEPPSTVFLSLRAGIATVRGTPSELDRVERIFHDLGRTPPLVQIDSRFITIPLGRIVLPEGKAFAIWTADQTREFWKALQSSVPAIAPLAQPRITTLSARQAQVSMLQPHSVRYPGQTEPTLENFGFTLDAIPNVAEDGTSITLLTFATQREFLGYDASDPRHPRMRERRGDAASALWDGQTLVLRLADVPGGARPDGPDSDAESYAFIIPRLIDPAGNPIHPDDAGYSSRTNPPSRNP